MPSLPMFPVCLSIGFLIWTKPLTIAIETVAYYNSCLLKCKQLPTKYFIWIQKYEDGKFPNVHDPGKTLMVQTSPGFVYFSRKFCEMLFLTNIFEKL